MAIKYGEVMDSISNLPLTKDELILIDEAEKHIDETILRVFDCGSISINLDIANFKWSAKRDDRIHIKEARRALMQKELEKRYMLAGWEIKINYGEDDGPNRPGFDYWVLSGKK